MGPLVRWTIGPLVHWSISQLAHWSIGPNVNKVKFLSERTSGVPPVIFLTKTTTKVSKHLEENWYKLETRKLKSRKGLGEEWGLTGVQVQRKVSIFKIHFPFANILSLRICQILTQRERTNLSFAVSSSASAYQPFLPSCPDGRGVKIIDSPLFFSFDGKDW